MKKTLLMCFMTMLTVPAMAQVREMPQHKNLLNEYNIGAEERFEAKKLAEAAEMARRRAAPARKFIGEMPELVAKKPTVFEGEEYNKTLEQSIFPLQDQIRFWGKKADLSQNQCNGGGMFAVYNLRLNEADELDYDCVGYVHAACGLKCFEDGVFFGTYQPEFACEGGKVEQIFSDSEDDDVETLKKQVCVDEKGKVLWQRKRNDNYVFDYKNQLMYFQSRNMFISYFNNKVDKEFIYDMNEYKYYDSKRSEDFFHVRYERDANKKIVKEFHFNKDEFPYYIYVAEYGDKGCKKITKYDGYNGTVEIYKFK